MAFGVSQWHQAIQPLESWQVILQILTFEFLCEIVLALQDNLSAPIICNWVLLPHYHSEGSQAYEYKF